MTNRININDKEYIKLFDNDDIGEVLDRIVGVEERDRARLSRAVFCFFDKDVDDESGFVVVVVSEIIIESN